MSEKAATVEVNLEGFAHESTQQLPPASPSPAVAAAAEGLCSKWTPGTTPTSSTSGRPPPLRRKALLACGLGVILVIVVGLAVALPLCLKTPPSAPLPAHSTPYRASFPQGTELRYRYLVSSEVAHGGGTSIVNLSSSLTANVTNSSGRLLTQKMEYLVPIRVVKSTPANTTLLAMVVLVGPSGSQEGPNDTTVGVPFRVELSFLENSLSLVQVLGLPNQSRAADVMQSVVLHVLRVGWKDGTGFLTKEDTSPATFEVSNSTNSTIIEQGGEYIRKATPLTFAEVSTATTILNLTSPQSAEQGDGLSPSLSDSPQLGLRFGIVVNAETETLSSVLRGVPADPTEVEVLSLQHIKVHTSLSLESITPLAEEDLRLEVEALLPLLSEPYPFVLSSDASFNVTTTASPSGLTESPLSPPSASPSPLRPSSSVGSKVRTAGLPDIPVNVAYQDTVAAFKVLGLSSRVVTRFSVAGRAGDSGVHVTTWGTMILFVGGFQTSVFELGVDFNSDDRGPSSSRGLFGTRSLSYTVVIPTPVFLVLVFTFSVKLSGGATKCVQLRSASPLVFLGTLTPYVEILAEGTAAISAAVAEVGGCVEGHLLQANLPLALTYDGPQHRFTVELGIGLAPVSLRAYLYYRTITIGRCKIKCFWGHCLYYPCPTMGGRHEIGGDWGWSSGASQRRLLFQQLQ